VTKAGREFFFSTMEPFYKAMVIYVLALVLALLSWFNLSDLLRRSAFYLIFLAWLIHTFGLVFRMYLEGRPPVTNLYSSAIFIGWAAVILGMVLEKIYHDGIGCVVAGFVGFVTLIIAHNLALGGDTMEMMRRCSTPISGWPPTSSPSRSATPRPLWQGFWPSSTSCAACSPPRFRRKPPNPWRGWFMASFVSQRCSVLWARCWRHLGRPVVGPVLGLGPKENGALLIVLWNATILHARWGGLVRERGLMNLAVFGNIVTSFSWFGVNMLGIGLHSYGFTDAAFKWLILFIATQVALILLGLLPVNLWRSFRPAQRAGTV